MAADICQVPGTFFCFQYYGQIFFENRGFFDPVPSFFPSTRLCVGIFLDDVCLGVKCTLLMGRGERVGESVGR